MGSGCGLFEVRKIGDEYFTYLVECKNPKACTIVLRGASKDILNEVPQNRLISFSIDIFICAGGAELAGCNASGAQCYA